MATGLNLEVLEGMGFAVPDSSPNDMVVALRLDDDADVATALAAVDAALVPTRPSSGDATVAPPRTTASALRDAAPDALVLVSVPGASATVEAMDALEAGHDVMIFSDNVPVAEEVALKQLRRLPRRPRHGPRLRHRGHRRRRAGLRQRRAARPDRHRRRLRHRLPAAAEPAPPRRRDPSTGSAYAMRSASAVATCRRPSAGSRPARRCAGSTPTPRSTSIVVVSKPPAAEVAEASRRTPTRWPPPSSSACSARGQRDLTAVADAALAPARPRSHPRGRC